MNATYELRDTDGRRYARQVSAPRAPWQTCADPEPGPWFELPEREERAPFFDARSAGSSEPVRKYEEHASYPIEIELPFCGLCGAVKARCEHHCGWTLALGERFEDVTATRRNELLERVARWTDEAAAFRARFTAPTVEVACG